MFLKIRRALGKYDKLQEQYKRLIHKDTQTDRQNNVESKKLNLSLSNQIESENIRAGSLARLGHLLDVNNLLETFRDFQLVDLQRSKKTAYEKVYYIRKFLAQLDKRLVDVTREDVRGYLKKLNRSSSATYKNTLAALKVFLEIS